MESLGIIGNHWGIIGESLRIIAQIVPEGAQRMYNASGSAPEDPRRRNVYFRDKPYENYMKYMIFHHFLHIFSKK